MSGASTSTRQTTQTTPDLRSRPGELSERREGTSYGIEVTVNGAGKHIDVDDCAVLVLHEIDDAGHCEGVVIADDDDPVRGPSRGVASLA
jgi:hypothetical protein